MKVPMLLPLSLTVPAAYYYHHQHLLHFSSYLSYKSCPDMPKCVVGTRIRPRICNQMALSKAWACKAFSVTLERCADPAETAACIRPASTAVAAKLITAALGCHQKPAHWSELDCIVCCILEVMNNGVRKGDCPDCPLLPLLSQPYTSNVLRKGTISKCCSSSFLHQSKGKVKPWQKTSSAIQFCSHRYLHPCLFVQHGVSDIGLIRTAASHSVIRMHIFIWSLFRNLRHQELCKRNFGSDDYWTFFMYKIHLPHDVMDTHIEKDGKNYWLTL